MRISDWSSDVCSSDLDLRIGVHDGTDGFRHTRSFGCSQRVGDGVREEAMHALQIRGHQIFRKREIGCLPALLEAHAHLDEEGPCGERPEGFRGPAIGWNERGRRSEEHTSELQSLMRISYAVFCLKKKK